MGETVKRLPLIDAEKFNSLIDLLQTSSSRQKLLDTTTRTPEEAGLIESHGEAVKSVKNKSSLASRDIINFLNKQDNYKKSLLPTVNDDDGDGNGGNAAPRPAGTPVPVKPSTVAGSRRLITQFLESKNIKPTEQGIRVSATKHIPVSYEDMITDLTHNYNRTQGNLTLANRDRVIGLLKKVNLPVSYICNREIKEQYKIAMASEKTSEDERPTTSRTYSTPRRPTTCLRRPATSSEIKSRIGKQRSYFFT